MLCLTFRAFEKSQFTLPSFAHYSVVQDQTESKPMGIMSSSQTSDCLARCLALSKLDVIRKINSDVIVRHILHPY